MLGTDTLETVVCAHSIRTQPLKTCRVNLMTRVSH